MDRVVICGSVGLDGGVAGTLHRSDNVTLQFGNPKEAFTQMLN